ncbi:hypothetical protein ACNQGP_00855 [Flavobacterium sp. GT2N3]|uniref:hypothetical protein n=1 Tax=unclassified Flavobacterium TaxID=196869 RepID=UPI003AAE148C
MHTIELPDAKIKRYIPSDLSECDQQQYIDMCELIFHFQNDAINYDEFRTHAVYKLMNMIPKTIKELENQTEEQKAIQAEKFANIYMISELIDEFFDTDDNGVKIIKQYYTNNPVPSFKPLMITYYGPADQFRDMTFGEYRDGLRLFHDFHATGDMHILTLLTALFYRPKKSFHCIKKRLASYDGNIRERYNSNTLDERAKGLKTVPIGFIYGFYLLFASFQKYLIDAKILWGGQEIDFSILFESSKTEESSNNDVPGIGMDSIAFSMAESGTFGNIKEVDNTNFWEIMVRMYDLRRTDLERIKHEANATTK